MWSNLVLGLWLMVSPFVLAILNLRVFRVLWEDLILGFGIATFSLSPGYSTRPTHVVVAIQDGIDQGDKGEGRNQPIRNCDLIASAR
jgi:hypothetical protein